MKRAWWPALLAALAWGCTQLPSDDGELAKQSTYLSDTLIVRAILDDNGRAAVSVHDVMAVEPVNGVARVVELNLDSLGIDHVPASVVELTALRLLNISRNQFTRLPLELSRLRNLQALVARSNQLTAIPSEYGQITSLAFLDLGFNQIDGVPVAVAQLPGLWQVRLDHNLLTSVPLEFVNKASLDTFDIRYNHICPPTVPAIADWLTSKDPGWETTQTCP